MEMILLDWTRMGKTFCIAGLIPDGSGLRAVRPMPSGTYAGGVSANLHGPASTSRVSASASSPTIPPRNLGWFGAQLGAFHRWDVVSLIGESPAEIERPHTEDVWVNKLRSTGRTVPSEQRSAILRSTVVQGYRPHFGIPLLNTRTSAYLKPGIGERSLVTIVAPAHELFFEASKREGAADVDVRVRLKVPGVGVK